MQNQQNKTPELQKTLNLFRQDIDQIDHQIIALLEERMEIISQVGELKKSNKEKFFIRSSREADMIKKPFK
jgi:chorismate mutase